jgi:hypothetical protein
VTDTLRDINPGQGPVFYQSHLHRCLAVT